MGIREEGQGETPGDYGANDEDVELRAWPGTDHQREMGNAPEMVESDQEVRRPMEMWDFRKTRKDLGTEEEQPGGGLEGSGHAKESGLEGGEAAEEFMERRHERATGCIPGGGGRRDDNAGPLGQHSRHLRNHVQRLGPAKGVLRVTMERHRGLRGILQRFRHRPSLWSNRIFLGRGVGQTRGREPPVHAGGDVTIGPEGSGTGKETQDVFRFDTAGLGVQERNGIELHARATPTREERGGLQTDHFQEGGVRVRGTEIGLGNEGRRGIGVVAGNLLGGRETGHSESHTDTDRATDMETLEHQGRRGVTARVVVGKCGL